jgi:ubiquinone/menaquinone biosynthesis C-methylase UbiE
MFKKFIENWKQRRLARQLRKPGGKAGVRTGMMMNKANETLYDFTLGQMQLQSADRILEIGFGNGMLFEKIFRHTADIHVTGIDYSADMVKTAGTCNQPYIQRGQLRLCHGSSDQLPFRDGEFDKIFCINVIYFWGEPGTHLREISRVLKPGGRFYATIRSKESLEQMPFSKYGFAIRTVEEWQAIIEQNGLQWQQASLYEEPGKVFRDEMLKLRSYCLQAVKR